MAPTRLRRLLARIRSAEDGQALAEFALVIPLLLVLVLGILDFGRAFNYKNNLTSLVNQAARYAEVDSCSPCAAQSVQSYVQSTADSGTLRNYDLNSGTPLIQICFPSGSSGQQGQQLKVIASYPYSWLPLLQSKAGLVSPTTLTTSVTVRVLSSYKGDSTDAYTVVSPCPS